MCRKFAYNVWAVSVYVLEARDHAALELKPNSEFRFF
jgi:hypothetical protein